MKTKNINSYLFITCAILLACTFACKKTEVTNNSSGEIESISYSVLKRLEPITLTLKKDIKYPENLQKACSLSESVEGEWKTEGANKIIFTPSVPYDFNKILKLTVDIGLLIENVAQKQIFSNIFTIAKPELKVSSAEIIPSKNKDDVVSFEAVCEADIPIELETVKKMLNAKIEIDGVSKDTSIEIIQGSNTNQYKIKLSNIKRQKNTSSLIIQKDLKQIGSDEVDKIVFSIPAEANFEVSSIMQESNNEIIISFSDQLDKGQDLRGFIEVTGMSRNEYATSIVDHKIKLFSSKRDWPDNTQVKVLQGIKNIYGKKITKASTFKTNVAWETPYVYFINKGNIIPSKDKATILISTKNLKGISVEAFQIYGHNMLQFFQNNSSLSGTYALKRVGEPVWRQSFDFEWDDAMKNKGIWHTIDISPLIKKFPGGMFEIRVSFSKKHSQFKSSNQNEDFSSLPFPKDITELENFEDVDEAYWKNNDLPEDVRYSFWKYRDNPSHPAFYLPSYNSGCLTQKNVLVSNIGLSVKQDRDGKLYIAATDLISAKPLSGVNVKLFTYAQKEVESGTTDSQGLLMLNNAKKASFVQAEKNGDYNWIHLGERSLSVSHFQVDGEKTKKGIKGYIYGERGVWRPGDNIHLVFILQDLEKNLPKEFPVNFTLEDPLGKKTDFKTFTKSVDGFYRIDTKTNEADKTGNWTARVTAGGKTWIKNIKVETIIPNRLFINIKPKKDYFTDGSNTLDLHGEWLHGAKASNLKSEISARYYLDRNPFPKFKDFNFINPEMQVKSSLDKLWNGNLDENGNAVVNFSLLSGTSSPSKLKAVLETRIYEPSGAFSSENKLFDYSPFTEYVGMQNPVSDDESRPMLYTDKDQTLNFAVVNSDGELVKGKTSLSVKLYKLDWYWWWETNEESVNYTNSRNTRLKNSWDVTADNGKASLKLRVNDNDWGRYLIYVKDNNSNHSSAQIVYFDWAGWASRNSSSNDSASIISLTTNKVKYSVGETAQINFPSYKNGKSLITIEKNGKILKQEWVTSTGTQGSYSIKLDSSMAPNIYVHVSLIQEHGQTENSLPIRLYGITPVMIEDANSRLTPIVKAPDSFEPNSKASFTVSEKNGKAMTCTFAVVDEGLLGLTAFSTKNPWDNFYKKESSQITSWDIFDSVMDAYHGELATVLSVGGGGFIDSNGTNSAQRFKPVVFFFGPYELKANEKKKIEFDMPQYIGSVRIMVVAGKNGAYGSCEQNVKVKSDLIVMPTLPRTLGSDETIEVPVTVFNGTSKEKNANISLKVDGCIHAVEKKDIVLQPNKDSTAVFTVKAEKMGTATFYAEASASGLKTAKSKTEIAVLSRGTPYSNSEVVSISPGKNWINDVSLKGINGSKNLNVEVSQMPALGLEKRLKYLIDYPYGCIEQITSKGFPQLYLPSMVSLTQEQVKDVKEHINSVLDRYQNYQLRSGGFSYWPNGSDENFWATNYAGHFMIEAKKAGYLVNESIYNLWLSRQIDLAKNWSSNYADQIENQAYRLFTLALAGSPELGAMNRLNNMEASLNNIAKALLAASYALAGQQRVAQTLLEKVEEPTSSYRSFARNYSSKTRDAAVILTAYTAIDDKSRSGNLIKKLAKVSSSDEWLSTQETSWILMSLAPYYKFDSSKVVNYEIITGGNTLCDSLNNTARLTSFAINNETTKKLEIKNTGSNMMYATITTSGHLKPGDEISEMSNLAIASAIYVESENHEYKKIDVADLKKSDRFKFYVEVKNTTQNLIENLALSIPIPTGWEITNTRLVEGDEDFDKSHGKPLFDYQDIRDTHIFTHFSLQANDSKVFTFDATATYGGSYYIPAIYVEAMYDNNYRALEQGTKVNVISK